MAQPSRNGVLNTLLHDEACLPIARSRHRCCGAGRAEAPQREHRRVVVRRFDAILSWQMSLRRFFDPSLFPPRPPTQSSTRPLSALIFFSRHFETASLFPCTCRSDLYTHPLLRSTALFFLFPQTRFFVRPATCLEAHVASAWAAAAKVPQLRWTHWCRSAPVADQV